MKYAGIPQLGTQFGESAKTILRPVQDGDLVNLQKLLDIHHSDDPYQKSAAYFAMTGRNGLWIVANGDTAILVCRHPNLSDTHLIFPTVGKADYVLFANTVHAIQKTGQKVQLARFDNNSMNMQYLSRRGETTPVPENILDWAYPVHTLDTKLVTEHSGNKFQQFRTKLNKLDRQKITAMDLDPRIHKELITQIIDQWGEDDPDKITPYQRLLSLFDKLPLAGRIIFHEGKPAGFSIWEKTDQQNGFANAYAHIGLQSIPGMSRYVMLDMCQKLENDGYSQVCIGGSENAGLNQFKQQMRPIKSVSLVSMSYTLKPTHDVVVAHSTHNDFGKLEA